MQFKYFNLLAIISLAQAASTIYEQETVTENSTAEVTITSCSGHPSCVADVATTTDTTVTETVNGVETIYTTVCDLTESSQVAKAPTTAAAAPSSSSEEIEYVDITTTPTVTASTGVEATVTQQSTLVSSYSSANNSSLAAVNAWEGAANQNVAFGAAGLAGLAALLI